jgi:proline dehydrogenase
MSTISLMRRTAGSALNRMPSCAAKAYVAGDELTDALAIAEQWEERGSSSTLGFWDSDQDTVTDVAQTYRRCIEAIRCSRNYISIKLPSLRYSPTLLADIAEHARRASVRLHFDSMWPQTVEETQRMIDVLLDARRTPMLGYTLAGRWKRSVADARWASERGLFIRVVKGQWPDPEDPRRDTREGYLAVIDALAGHARQVAIATHDVTLAAKAITKLRGSNTRCEMELLHGLPMRQSLALARHLKVPVRIYIPYGKAHLPYAVKKVKENPRLAWWLLKDFVVGRFM